jgi:uncharacterized protein (TIGR03435 family)
MTRALLTLTCAAAIGSAQPAADVFEVASIKPSTSRSVRGSDGGPGSKDPTRYIFGQATPFDLIVVAYHIDNFQVSSKADLTQPRFDLDAKVPAGATKEQFRAMLQNLLAERFHLKFHRESRDFPAYELAVAKAGLKIKPNAASGPSPQLQPKQDGFPTLTPNRPGLASNFSTTATGGILVRMRVQQQTLAVFAHSLRLPDGEPIVDKTGLTGAYDFLLEYAYEPPGAIAPNTQPPAGPDPFHALEQQLGLQLIPKKLPFDVLVVDSIDKSPTSN